MIAQVRSELWKMRTTRTNIGLLAGLVVLILFGVIAGSFGTESDLAVRENQRELIGNGTFAAAFAALVGIMAMTSEYRHGTIRATLLFNADRAAVVMAKVLASMLVGLSFGVLGSGVALAGAIAMIRVRGFDLLLDLGDVRRFVVGTVVMCALWGALGVGIGAVLRNQVMAIVSVFAWVFVVEVILFQQLPSIGRYAPGAAGTALTGTSVGDSSAHLVGALGGGALLAAYAAVFLAVGVLVTNRRDVT